MLPPETQLRVQFANGCIDDKHTYTPAMLRWSLTYHAWDVAAVCPVGEVTLRDGRAIDQRQANGSYS
jgi:hypothetical protein